MLLVQRADTLIQSAAVAFILVCDAFLQSHTYLKDSAVLVRKPHTRRVDAKGRTVDRLYDICQIGTWIKGPGVISAKMESSLGAQRMVAAPRHG